MEKNMYKIFQWIKMTIPVKRLTMEKATNKVREEWLQKYRDDEKRHDEEIEKIMQRADKFIDKCASIQFDVKDGNRYAVMVEFDPNVCVGYRQGEELQFLGKLIGRRIEREITTARFVQSAENFRERRMYPPILQLFDKPKGAFE